MLTKIIGLGLSLLVMVDTGHAYFSDVPTNHPHAAAIKYVESTGIVSGYQDDTFRPDAPINRVELLKILVEAQPSPNDDCGVSAKYTDTDSLAWYQGYLEAAACRGIATGYSDFTFKPANPVLVAEAFKMITKTFGYAVGSEGGEWYARYLTVLANKFAIPRTIASPDSALTRSQMAEMIYRLEKGVESHQSSHTAETLASDSTPVVTAQNAEEIDFAYVSKNNSTVSITTDDTYRYIRSNGLPNHVIDINRNANTVTSQDHNFRVPLAPVYSADPWIVKNIGVALNGVVFSQAEKGALSLDIDYAHVQPNGAYHYHGVPTALVDQLAAQNTDDQLLIGYAADGHGIYYSQAGLYQPSFQLKTDDYEFVAGSGDLDDCNGRWVNGAYRYFVTKTYPYQPRCLHGTADGSFDKGHNRGAELDAPRTDFAPSIKEENVADPVVVPRTMPHEVCADMNADFDKVNNNCVIRDNPSNQIKCAAGGGVVRASVCQFFAPSTE